MNRKYIFKAFKLERLTLASGDGEKGMAGKLGSAISLKDVLLPKNNHWLKRASLVFAFILFDYFSTLAFCHAPFEEANVYARAFMDILGLQAGLTLFVLMANLPIYLVLCLDSHLVKLPPTIAMVIETFIDVVFAWFVAGLHFSGGSSWFWFAPDLPRQAIGALLYLTFAFLIVKPHRPRYDSQ